MGSKIHVIDDQAPEDVAMLQALYSRSSASVEQHLEKVRSTGSGKFMENYYVGYGHKSIGDCGSTTLFFEGVSMLAAKAIQDWPLYSGQETSTRFLDFASQPIENPVGSLRSEIILDRWINFYTSTRQLVEHHVAETHPRRPEEDEKVYQKAVKARTFDILRGFLPAGVTTQLSWHTNLRQAADKLLQLRHHPLEEVNQLASQALLQLRVRYPSSFSHRPTVGQEHYHEQMMDEYSYFDPAMWPETVCIQPGTFDRYRLGEFTDALKNRPPRTELPAKLLSLGLLRFRFQMDFGSFRDLQRHRNGVCRMPLLTTKFGFHEWYLDQLPSELREVAEKLLDDQRAEIAALECAPVVAQYYIPMGYKVPCDVSYGLPAAVYVMELRSGKTVHATMRRVAHEMAREVGARMPEIPLYVDFSEDDWDIRRGLQDIVSKR